MPSGHIPTTGFIARRRPLVEALISTGAALTSN